MKQPLFLVGPCTDQRPTQQSKGRSLDSLTRPVQVRIKHRPRTPLARNVLMTSSHGMSSHKDTTFHGVRYICQRNHFKIRG